MGEQSDRATMFPDISYIYILILRNMAVILTYVEQVLFLKQREQLVHKMKTREKCTDININLFCEKC